MYFPKVYVPKVYFPEMYVLKVYFVNVYFSKMYFSKVYISKVFFENHSRFTCFLSFVSLLHFQEGHNNDNKPIVRLPKQQVRYESKKINSLQYVFLFMSRCQLQCVWQELFCI